MVVEHRIMVPHGVSGTVKFIHTGSAKVEDIVCTIAGDKGEPTINMIQRWPVRWTPYREKLVQQAHGYRAESTDTFFPIASGGTAAVPTFRLLNRVQHQLAKWADADIIVYVGAASGNDDRRAYGIPNLYDPRTYETLMKVQCL